MGYFPWVETAVSRREQSPSVSNAQRKTAGLHWGRANSLLHSDGGRAASVGEERALKREGQAREKGVKLILTQVVLLWDGQADGHGLWQRTASEEDIPLHSPLMPRCFCIS